MLRIYFLQQWFDLSDPGAEEALYDSQSMRRFVGIDLGREPVPDETTICHFRHLLEQHDLGTRLFETVHEHLERRGIKLARGTIVDATIISAPSSLTRPPIDAGFFETEHHAQVSGDIRAAIMGGRLIALTAGIGSGKTVLSRRLRADLEREGRVIVSRSLSIDKAEISLPLLEAALFYDLSPEKTVKISSQSERRVRDLQELFRRAKKPVALFADDAHDLHPKTLTALKRLIELVAEGGGQLSIVLVGHPKLKNDLRRAKMEEIGERTTVFEFGGLRDRQRDYIDYVLKASLEEGVTPDDVLTDEAATMLAAKLKTPLQIGQHLVRAFGAGFEIGAKPIAAGVADAVLSSKLDELEPQLTRNAYDLRSLVEQFDAKPAEIRRLLRGDLDAGRAQELMDEMRTAGLPT